MDLGTHNIKDETEMISLAKAFVGIENQEYLDFLKQAAKELFLLQSSDWQFLITTWTARDYAENRLSKHHEYFCTLSNMLRNIHIKDTITPVERNFLELCRSNLFEEIDPK